MTTTGQRYAHAQDIYWCRGCGIYHGKGYPCTNQDARPQHPEPVTMPVPPTLNGHQHHWLDSERASSPSVAEWLDGNWWCINEVGPVTPEEMWRRGWRWLARAVPPMKADVAPSPAPTTTRPSWDQTWMDVVAVMARRSTCARRAVGCVIVDRSNNFLSEGFNGVESGTLHCNEGHLCSAHDAPSGTDLDGCLATHAEINALVTCNRPYASHSLYVSVSPCLSCLKAIMRTRISRIVFAEAYAGSMEARDRWMAKPGREWVYLPYVDSRVSYVRTLFREHESRFDCQNERP